jgi:hypothetical protein
MTVSTHKNMQIWRIYACMYRFEYMYQYTVLLHNGGFCNACTMKRCLHRKVDFKTNALNNAHVSQRLHNYILEDLNKLVVSGYNSQNTTC